MPSILNEGLGVLPAEIMQNFKEGLEPEPKKKKKGKKAITRFGFQEYDRDVVLFKLKKKKIKSKRTLSALKNLRHKLSGCTLKHWRSEQ